MEIEFDQHKAISNFNKHAVTFDEAVSCLLDPNALVQEDLDTQGEHRWILLGMSDQARLLTVIYTLRDDAIRIISARKSTTKEAKNYA